MGKPSFSSFDYLKSVPGVISESSQVLWCCELGAKNGTGVLYNTLSEIAKIKVENRQIIDKVISIAIGVDKVSQKGFIGTSIQMVAIATLRSLGNDEIYQSLSENEKKYVKGIYFQNSWPKSIKDWRI